MATIQETQPAAQLPVWRQLRWSLILWFIILAVLPVVVVAYVIINQLEDQARDQNFNELEAVAQLKTENIDLWLADNVTLLESIDVSQTHHNWFVAVSTGTEFGRGILPLTNDLLVQITETNNGYSELFLYDLEGRILASSNDSQVDKLVRLQPYFADSFLGVHFEPPFYEVGSSELNAMLSIPIVEEQPSGAVVAVLAARLNLNQLGVIMSERAGLGDSGETYLVSAESNYLLTPSRFEGYEINRAYRSVGIDAALLGENGSGTYDDYRDPAVRVLGVYRWLPEIGAALLAEVDESEALAPFNTARNVAVAVVVAAALLAAALGFTVALTVTRPITRLTRTATQLAAGDFSERSHLQSRNELGVLSDAFNSMADQLGEMVTSLENRVEARTRDLQIAAQVSEQAAMMRDINALLPAVVELTKNQFDLYHVHIYLYDGDRHNLVLASGAGEAGQVMKDRGHSIPADARSLVAQAARENISVIVDDVKSDPNFLANPLLPDTRSEAALPLAITDRVIGVIDVQSDEIARFDSDLLAVLGTFSGQLAIAVENARLFSEMERTGRQEHVLAEISQAIQRATSLDDVLQSVTRELGRALGVSDTTIELRMPETPSTPDDAGQPDDVSTPAMSS